MLPAGGSLLTPDVDDSWFGTQQWQEILLSFTTSKPALESSRLPAICVFFPRDTAYRSGRGTDLSPTSYSYLLTYLLPISLYGLLRALASLITDAHSSLSTAFRRHFKPSSPVGSSQNLPSQSRSSHSPASLWFTLRYFLNYPFIIYTYETFYPFRSFPYNVCYCV